MFDTEGHFLQLHGLSVSPGSPLPLWTPLLVSFVVCNAWDPQDSLPGILSCSLYTFSRGDVIYSSSLNHHVNIDDPALVNSLWVLTDRTLTRSGLNFRKEDLLMYIVETYSAWPVSDLAASMCSNTGPSLLSISGTGSSHVRLAIPVKNESCLPHPQEALLLIHPWTNPYV